MKITSNRGQMTVAKGSAPTERLEVREEPRNTQEKLMDHIMNLEKHMERIEASQEKKERYKCHEASVIGSVLGQGKPMSREALDFTPPRRVSPGVSRSTYFNVHQRGYAEAAANVEMAQTPQPALPQHFVPPPPYQSASPQQFVPRRQYDRVPDSRQRELDIDLSTKKNCTKD